MPNLTGWLGSSITFVKLRFAAVHVTEDCTSVLVLHLDHDCIQNLFANVQLLFWNIAIRIKEDVVVKRNMACGMTLSSSGTHTYSP